MTLLLAILAAASPALANPYGANPYASSEISNEEDPFTWEARVEKADVGRRIVLVVHVPPGDVVYRDQLDVVAVDAGALELGAPDLPPAIRHADPVTGDDRELYDRDVYVYVPIVRDGVGVVRFSVRHQGCRPGLCFPPKTQTLQVVVPKP